MLKPLCVCVCVCVCLCVCVCVCACVCACVHVLQLFSCKSASYLICKQLQNTEAKLQSARL